ncbi:MAG: NUDIX domain-containing protein [Clostridium sp.]|nr:NUDIX domain-containing protein [Clostridium sp.]
MEYFELLREDGNKLGKCKERNQVHQDGDWHGGSHVWVVRRNDNHELEVLLQKRRMDKDSFPGCLDVSCAGHMTAGEDFLSTALRELKEELGIDAKEEQLYFLFSQNVEGKYVFHGKPFYNREVNYVYLLEPEVSLEKLSYQPEEIEELKWVPMKELISNIRKKDPGYCIIDSEMERLYDYLQQSDI